MISDLIHPISVIHAQDAASLFLIERRMKELAPSIDNAIRIATEVAEKYDRKVNITVLFEQWQNCKESEE